MYNHHQQTKKQTEIVNANCNFMTNIHDLSTKNNKEIHMYIH